MKQPVFYYSIFLISFFAMKSYLLVTSLLFAATAASAQTIPFDPSAQVRGGSQNQTIVPPVNPALNQSTIQGPPDMQRTPTNNDAQPTRQLQNGSLTPIGTPEASPTARPDIREQPLIKDSRPRQSSDVMPSRSRQSNSSNVLQH